MKIAMVQFNMVYEDIETNKKEVAKLVKIAHLNHADMIVFPELTLTGFSMAVEEIYDDSIDDFFKELSKKYFIKIVYGKVEKNVDGYYNNLKIVNGYEELLSYNKIHPFLKEGEYYRKGNKIECCNVNGYNICGFICYDLRFPEIFQVASRTSDLIVVIASWPKQRSDHWTTLLKARAIENQCYILGVNRVGHDPNEEYIGNSVLFDPWGMQINEYSRDEKIIYVYLERSLVDYVRTNRNFRDSRREDLYLELLGKNKL